MVTSLMVTRWLPASTSRSYILPGLNLTETNESLCPSICMKVLRFTILGHMLTTEPIATAVLTDLDP